jgi:hypothetical protein
MLKRVPWKFVLPALLVGGLLVIVVLALLGPAVGNVFSDVVMNYAPVPMQAPTEAALLVGSPGELAALPPQASRLIIYTVHMSLVVGDTEAAVAQIENLVGELGGYVTSSSTQQYEEGVRASLTVRVPSEELDRALERLRGLALEVRSESRTGEDVTEEYVDLSARLEILEAAERELLELYQTRQASGEVADILEVYRQLVVFRQDIEALQGRIQYLEQSAALATVTVELTPDVLAQPIEVGGWRPEGTVRAAFQALLSSLQFLADAVIWFFITLLPLLVVIGAPAYGIWRLVRRWRARRKVPPAE